MRVRRLAPALLLLCCLGCGAPSDAPSVDEASAAAAEEPAATPAASKPRGRPLPAFSGWTLDGQKLDVSSLLGKRFVLFFFNPEVEAALGPARAMREISAQRGAHNFEIVGVATGSDRDTARRFVASEGLDFRVLDDSSAELARRFGLTGPIAVLGVDAEGFFSFGMAGFANDEPAPVAALLREALRLPAPESGPSRPMAPTFSAAVLDGEEPFDLAAQRGRPVVLVFFLHTCPHCHAALHALGDDLATIPEAQRPVLVGIEVTGRTWAVREALKNLKLDFFPVLFDEGDAIQNAYGVFRGVPDIFFIDREGRIVAHMQGWDERRDPALARMRVAKLAGTPVPMLLRAQGYSGSEVCGVCHEVEHETWTFTTHASAYDTLVKHGADGDDECVSCHVVGHGQTGGFENALATPELEDVGCENCHGRGGPHLSPGYVVNDAYAPVCVTCHDQKHSLGFDYATFAPRVSHAENAKLLSLPPEEKARLLAERGRPGGSLLPTQAAYTGSEACAGCHAAEYETWSAQPHAHAGETLVAKGKAGDAACLACHTTGFDRPGGFPAGASAPDHPDLGRVGCESCHGPGGEHVGPDAVKIGTIVSLGDKCDSCVILQICGSCHDDANDPGFEFEVQDKIDAQRHGTIEPGTGRPKGQTASRADDRERLARAFQALEQR